MAKLVKIAIQGLAKAPDRRGDILGEDAGLMLATRLVRFLGLLGKVSQRQGHSSKLSQRLSQQKISWSTERGLGPNSGPNDRPHPHADRQPRLPGQRANSAVLILGKRDHNFCAGL